jgi:DNA-binding NarL/FixJ family response regulator
VKLWTHPEQRRLLSMRASGMDIAAIAAALGRTESAVRVRLKRLKAPPLVHRWTQQEDRLLVDLRAQGVSAKVIAARLGRTVGAIYHRVTALGMAS